MKERINIKLIENLKNMKIYVAADHAGFDIKKKIISELTTQEYEAIDLGTYSPETVDYPEYAQKLAVILQQEQTSRGVLICGSGIGISIAANRFKKIRAFVCHSCDETILARHHNDANVICFGSRTMEWPEIKKCLEIFLKTKFEGGRHKRRICKIDDCQDNI